MSTDLNDDFSTISSKDIRVSSAHKTVCNGKHSNVSAYGTQHIESFNNANKYIWKIRIDKIAESTDDVAVGIQDCASDFSATNWFCTTGAIGYAYCSDGSIWRDGDSATRGLSKATFKAGDTVSITVDLEQKLVLFSLNGTKIVERNDITINENLRYRLAISMEGRDTQCTLLDSQVFINVPKQKEPEQNLVNGSNNDIQKKYEQLQLEMTKKISFIEQYEKKMKNAESEIDQLKAVK